METVFVGPGEMAVRRAPAVLSCPVLGSCIALCIYDGAAQVAGLTHVMFSGKLRSDPAHAGAAVRLLLAQLKRRGAHKSSMVAFLVGGANLTGASSDPGALIHAELRLCLHEAGISIAAETVGGVAYYGFSFDVGEGRAEYSLRRRAPVKLISNGADLIERVLSLLLARTGADFRRYKPAFLARRIDRRLFRTGAKDYYAYTSYLKKHPEEYDALLDEMGINVTAFFRDKHVFRTLRDRVIPELSSRKRVRVWSAGCATGQEPYSLAMLLADAGIDATVFATDYKASVLARSKRGEYSRDDVAAIGPAMRKRYLRKSGESFIVSDALRKMVRFKRHDIVRDPPLKRIDVLLMRNVMIYFDSTLQAKVFARLSQSLRKGGFLVLGTAEEPLDKAKFQELTAKSHIYKVL